MDWCTHGPIRRALKTRRCSRLHPWKVHAWEVFNWWTGALVDRIVEPYIVHAWEVFDSWIVPAWSLKNEELFQIGLA